MNYIHEAIAIGRRILLELFRTYRTLLLWVIFPISMLLLNGFVLAEGSKITTDESFKLAAPATLIGAALFFSCLGGTMSTIVSERESLTIKRLLIAPLNGVSYFLGIFFAYATIGMGQTLIIYTVASFWNVRFSGSALMGILVILASIGSYVGMGFVLATKFARRAEDVNSLVAGVGVPLLILGGAFFPTTFLSKDLLLITQFNPVYHMSEAFTALSSDSKDLSNPDMILHLRFLVGFFIIAIASGWLAYKRMLQNESHL
ncbi:ABC transporter permease [Pseudanabaena mucicola]|uniref:Transport permease protein n=1 Tax=Pseudanabaena mucicola FACHB-723 TaxID=2692860 RepID=A0ABR7ZVX4_9CYAN|nr:ABC transporter permease [Pseudanabaena mucicola]MBD2187909.1 ABC transporter permease [Pseudanabaena mucicola FACHB-723]